MKNKLILTDCDGVLLDWPAQFHTWMQYRGYNRQDFAENMYYQENQYGLSVKEAKRQVEEFNSSAWMMGMPAHLDARSGVARLVEAGFKFHAITAIDDDPYARQLRMINLENLFGKDVFVELTCVGFDADKTQALLPYRDSGLVWLEDKWQNAVLGADLGLSSYAFTHAYNENEQDPRVKKVNSWHTLCGELLGVN